MKEKDVWSFLDNDNNKGNSNISKTKDSIEKIYSVSPQSRQKKTNNIAYKKATTNLLINQKKMNIETIVEW